VLTPKHKIPSPTQQKKKFRNNLPQNSFLSNSSQTKIPSNKRSEEGKGRREEDEEEEEKAHHVLFQCTSLLLVLIL
jgi:hypothetical protein